jgi:hypothetical protein
MKNLIILLLVIGAVVNAANLTTIDALATNAKPLWTLTYAATTGFNYASFVLTYNAGTAPSDAVTAAANSFGVACFVTDSTYALVASANTRAAFSFSVIGEAGGATANTAISTNWQPLLMTSHPLALYNTGNTISTAASIPCPIVSTPVGAIAALVSNVATWTFTVANGCGPVVQTGTVFYARCFSVVNQAKILSAAGGILVADVVGDKNITYTATAAAACATTGASTLATGATILAGIAYLQF